MSKRILVSITAALLLGLVAAPVVIADMVQKETTTTTTYSGTVQEIVPSSRTIVIKSQTAAEPARYTFTEKTEFVDAAGNKVTQETIKGSPVTVHYVKQGDAMIVERVVVAKPAGATIEKRTETKTIEED